MVITSLIIEIMGCFKKDNVELWVETAANSLFGIYVDTDPDQDNPKRHGTFDAKVITIDIGVFRKDIWDLYLDARILIGLIKRLDKKSVRRARIIDTMNNAVVAFKDDKKDAGSSRKILSLILFGAPVNIKSPGHNVIHLDNSKIILFGFQINSDVLPSLNKTPL